MNLISTTEISVTHYSNIITSIDSLTTDISFPKNLECYSNLTKYELLNMIPNIIQDIEIGKNYQVQGEEFELVIKPTNSSFLENSTHIYFENCEIKLREKFNISSSRIITFLQLELYNKKTQSLINQVEYQAYDDNRNILNLSICNDTDIQIIHLINESYDLSNYNSFKEDGIDIFNIDDSFFNDICHPYTDPDSNNDLVLEDRIKYIYQNYSLCEEGCTYDHIDLKNKAISCICKVKTNLSIEETTFSIKKFNDIEIESNFGLIKCYKLVFSLSGKLKNIGFIIFLVLFLIHIPLIINYIYKGIKPIKEFLQKEMIKYGYKSNNKKDKKIKNKRLDSPPPKNNKNSKLISSSIHNMNPSEIEIIEQINENDDQSKIKINNNNKKGKIIKDNKKDKNKQILINNVIIIDKNKNKKSKGKKIKKSKSKKIYNIPTQIKELSKEEKDKNLFDFHLININLNNKKIKEYTPKNSIQILNNYTYEEAIKYDMRSICLIFYIFLLSKQAAFHAFLFKSPLESFPLRLILLIFIISSDLALNAFFYLDDKISKKFELAQNLFLFTFSNNITIILLSTFIGFIFLTLFTNLSNSTNKIRDIFRNEEEKMIKNKKYIVNDKRKKEIYKEIKNILKKHKIKVIILIIIEFSLFLFFWYYVTAFCHVYSSTQLSWLLDSFLSILSRLIIECLFCLLFAKLYRMAVEANTHCLYKIVLFFYSFG